MNECTFQILQIAVQESISYMTPTRIYIFLWAYRMITMVSQPYYSLSNATVLHIVEIYFCLHDSSEISLNFAQKWNIFIFFQKWQVVYFVLRFTTMSFKIEDTFIKLPYTYRLSWLIYVYSVALWVKHDQ